MHNLEKEIFTINLPMQFTTIIIGLIIQSVLISKRPSSPDPPSKRIDSAEQAEKPGKTQQQNHFNRLAGIGVSFPIELPPPT